jgi:hypothetical protein
MIDYFTKWANAVPLVNKEAPTVAEGIFNGWYLQYGLPNSIHTDQGSEFTNDVLKHLNQRATVDAEFTTPYNPSANGEVERFNRTLGDCLSCYAESNPGLWHKYLPGVLFAYRTSVHATTGYTPFYLMYGREARSPIDILTSTAKDVYHDVVNYNTIITRELKKAHDIVRPRLLENAMRVQSKWNAAHPIKVTTYTKGDQVLMYKPNLNKQTGHPDHSAKFNKSWIGPYVVIEHRFNNESDVYVLEDPKTQRQWSVNVNKLTRYFPRTFLEPIRNAGLVPAAVAGDSDTGCVDDGGAELGRIVEPIVDGLVNHPLESNAPSGALAVVEASNTTVDGVTPIDRSSIRYHPTQLVSHAGLTPISQSDRTRISKQGLAREAKRQKLAQDNYCDYQAKLASHEFVRILSHGKTGNRFHYVVEWADPQFEPSTVWCDNVETTEAVERYWSRIPKGSRPRKFRQYREDSRKPTGNRDHDTTKKSDDSVDDDTFPQTQPTSSLSMESTQPRLPGGMRLRDRIAKRTGNLDSTKAQVQFSELISYH